MKRYLEKKSLVACQKNTKQAPRTVGRIHSHFFFLFSQRAIEI